MLLFRWVLVFYWGTIWDLFWVRFCCCFVVLILFNYYVVIMAIIMLLWHLPIFTPILELGILWIYVGGKRVMVEILYRNRWTRPRPWRWQKMGKKCKIPPYIKGNLKQCNFFKLDRIVQLYTCIHKYKNTWIHKYKYSCILASL